MLLLKRCCYHVPRVNLNFDCITVREHNVMHGKERIVQWTLQEQFPALARPIECDTCKNTTNEEGKKVNYYANY